MSLFTDSFEVIRTLQSHRRALSNQELRHALDARQVSDQDLKTAINYLITQKLIAGKPELGSGWPEQSYYFTDPDDQSLNKTIADYVRRHLILGLAKHIEWRVNAVLIPGVRQELKRIANLKNPHYWAQILAKQLLDLRFYWPARGQGWLAWGSPRVLEPPFKPFQPESPAALSEYQEYRQSGGLQALYYLVWNEPIPPLSELTIYDWRKINVMLPPDLKIGQETSHRFLLGLSRAAPLGFEVVGTSEKIVMQFVVLEEEMPSVIQQIKANFPGVSVRPDSDYLTPLLGGEREEDTKDGNAWDNIAVFDFGLDKGFLFPLRTWQSDRDDIWPVLLGALSNLKPGEVGAFQVLFTRTANPWAESARRCADAYAGKDLFSNEQLRLVKEKLAHPLFAVVIRAIGQAESDERADEIALSLGGALGLLEKPASNKLVAWSNKFYEPDSHFFDVLARISQRSGMLLNSEELVSLVHLPSEGTCSPKLSRVVPVKTKTAPDVAGRSGVLLGINSHDEDSREVRLDPSQRLKHTYVVGASGTGKSTLLLNLIVQDIREGRGVGVLDPHGDLIDQILGFVPEERLSDVVLFDPSDEEYPIGFNILSAGPEAEKNALSSDLVNVFRRLSTSWGDQMTSVLGNAILAILESEQGGTLMDLRRFLIERGYRQEFLKTVRDSHIVYYWQKEFPLLQGRPQASILTRLDTFLRPKLIRHMVGQKDNRLDLSQVLNQGRIFLGKLAQGAIGEENSYLLGSLLVSKFHQLALSRQEIPEPDRRDFFLYIDEFHNFITPSMSAILSGARKYHLALVLAHQELQQLFDRDTGVASAVLANAATRICFRVGDFDAHKLADGFSYFDAKDLQNLGVGEAIGRIERAENDFNLKTHPLPAVEPDTAQARQEKIRALSRDRYGTPRAQVAALVQVPIEALAPLSATPPIEKKTTTRQSEPVNKPAPATPRQLRASIPTHPEPHLLGRGGPEHTYLQNLIKRWGDNRGFRSIIEKPVLDGAGSVDVSLEKEGQGTIACEISVTTSPEHEIGNLEKCLKAGFEKIIFVSPERKTLNRVRELAGDKWSEPESGRIHFCAAEKIVDFLNEVAAQAAGTEGTVRGYKVKTSFRTVSEQEKDPKKQAVAETIMGALRRMKGK